MGRQGPPGDFRHVARMRSADIPIPIPSPFAGPLPRAGFLGVYSFSPLGHPFPRFIKF
jgi:hypothetical protein